MLHQGSTNMLERNRKECSGTKIEDQKKNQIKNFELKNLTNKIKTHQMQAEIEMTEQRVSTPEDTSIEIIHSKPQRNK